MMGNPFDGLEYLMWLGILFIVILVLSAPFVIWWAITHVTISIR